MVVCMFEKEGKKKQPVTFFSIDDTCRYQRDHCMVSKYIVFYINSREKFDFFFLEILQRQNFDYFSKELAI